MNEHAIASTISNLRSSTPFTSEPLYLRPLDPSEISGILSSITTKAQGVDGIDANTLRMTGDAVIPPLLDIVILSINNSIFPPLWTKAFVSPVSKVTNPSAPADFRPISIVCAASKIVEKAVYYQALDYLLTNKLLN